MNNVHDMGGMHGFGRVPYQLDDPSFHADWERRAWGLAQGCTQPEWVTLDCNRHYTERMPPALYLSYSYFERWTYSLTTRLLDGGFVTIEEVMQGKSASQGIARTDAPPAASVNPFSHGEFRRELNTPPQFQIGDQVKTHNIHPYGHTRLPRYVQDKAGEIHRHHGPHVLPDTNAHGQGESPTHLYTVAFAAQELWGSQSNPNDRVFAEIWECHLDAN